MTDSPSSPAPTAERKKLTPAAERALAEAEARRKAAAASAPSHQKEFQGPKGPEPTRYGDGTPKGSCWIFEAEVAGGALAGSPDSALSPGKCPHTRE